jgi:hypothetical protein
LQERGIVAQKPLDALVELIEVAVQCGSAGAQGLETQPASDELGAQQPAGARRGRLSRPEPALECPALLSNAPLVLLPIEELVVGVGTLQDDVHPASCLLPGTLSGLPVPDPEPSARDARPDVQALCDAVVEPGIEEACGTRCPPVLVQRIRCSEKLFDGETPMVLSDEMVESLRVPLKRLFECASELGRRRRPALKIGASMIIACSCHELHL